MRFFPITSFRYADFWRVFFLCDLFFLVAGGFRSCGSDQRALRSPFGNLRSAQSCYWSVPQLVDTGDSVGELWINTRAKHESVTNSIARKGQGTKSLVESRGKASGRVKGQSPLGSPQSTRGQSMNVRPTESRERVKGRSPLWSPEARPLVGSRGKAPWVPPSMVRRKQ